jgi:hypothetical protein
MRLLHSESRNGTEVLVIPFCALGVLPEYGNDDYDCGDEYALM